MLLPCTAPASNVARSGVSTAGRMQPAVLSMRTARRWWLPRLGVERALRLVMLGYLLRLAVYTVSERLHCAGRLHSGAPQQAGLSMPGGDRATSMQAPPVCLSM